MNEGSVGVGGVAALVAVRDALACLNIDVDDVARVEQVRLLEEIKAAAAAVQARVTAAFVASQRRAQAAAGVPADRVGRGVAAQVGLAMRISPFRAQRYCGWATILCTELPATYSQLAAGRTSEWRAMLVARESAPLSCEHRAVLDAELAPRLDSFGNRRVETEARRIAYRLDPAGFTARAAAADKDRRVTLRPAPDTMTRLTALLPVAQGVAAYAALVRAADSGRASGDTRGRGQIMADTLVQRVTGQATATEVPVEVNVLIGVDTLLGADDQPADLPGYGPIPAPYARTLIGDGRGDAATWLRRLFTRPADDALVQLESRRRSFTTSQQRLIRLRDQTCRTPWCEAPIRHTDHIVAAASGGPTSVSNAQGLCQACNHAKQAPDWHARPALDGATTTTTTPTGHTYVSRPPDPPGRPTTRQGSPVEHQLHNLIRAA